MLCGSASFAGAAHADGDFDSEGDQSQYEEFYHPPDPLPPGRPGDLIRTEPSRLVLEPSGQLGAIMATGTRIMYRSTDSRGNPIAVTGTYFEPDNPWPGNGPRPLVSYAAGTQGQGDQCAPSRMFNQGIHWSPWLDFMANYEETFIATMVARGFAVVMTDYEGLGTPGVHTYVNRLAEGQAVLDAARAAQRLPGTSLDPAGPVAFWGYSQGGGATASAAELAPTYAPELNVVGTYAGAPPANLAEMLPYLDGNAMVGVVGYVINGFIYAYPEWAEAIHDRMTPRGEDVLAKTRHQCAGETGLKFMFRHLRGYFTEDVGQLAAEQPFKTLFDMQRIGRLKPNAPVLIDINRYDPLVPWTQANQLGRDWCDQGANVEFWTNEQPPFLNKTSANHVLTMWVEGERGMQWMADRFNGVPAISTCGHF
ncbi:triacylglycerol lipase [Mycobacterium decipiens]|uniref:Triacylglycerol lipase n=1 Tax=Mycobacterium decipiens TaxID=1430326 RepID=A0A1X2LY99_9MYCO|nr:lipase family protein [Mycobacterium decipiens]OSC42165.1 triacylglycerol lipase [Mycobacterium decipiens]